MPTSAEFFAEWRKALDEAIAANPLDYAPVYVLTFDPVTEADKAARRSPTCRITFPAFGAAPE